MLCKPKLSGLLCCGPLGTTAAIWMTGGTAKASSRGRHDQQGCMAPHGAALILFARLHRDCLRPRLCLAGGRLDGLIGLTLAIVHLLRYMGSGICPLLNRLAKCWATNASLTPPHCSLCPSGASSNTWADQA